MMVIDKGLGRSAADAAVRLVAEITMGHVALVLGLEMSRPTVRVGRDWHQMLESCSLAGAGADAVYDPNWYNDGPLLG